MIDNDVERCDLWTANSRAATESTGANKGQIILCWKVNEFAAFRLIPALYIDLTAGIVSYYPYTRACGCAVMWYGAPITTQTKVSVWWN